MNPRTWRTTLRAAHLAIAAIAGAAVYALPLVSAEAARVVVIVAIPLLMLTGLGLWKQAQLRKALARRA